VKARVVTGLGVTSVLGTGAETFLRALSQTPEPLAVRGPLPIASFDASKLDEAARASVAEVPGFDPVRYLGDKGLRVLDRLTKLLLVGARLALEDGKLKKEGLWTEGVAERVGVIVSNAYGSLEAITELDRVAQLEDARYINPSKFPNTVSNSASGYVSIWEELRALNVTISDGNCGGLDAVCCADIFLETGRADQILVGGGEAMSEALWLAFRRLGEGGGLGGTRIGEGAAFLVLEAAETAAARGAKVLGRVSGYGTSFVASPDEATLIHTSRTAMERAARSALADAGLQASDVDLVVSGVSGLPRFDVEELAALASVVPDAPVVAPKLLLGEALGAGASLAMATSLAWLAGAAPSPVVRGSSPATVRTVLVTSVGYYGNASAVVMTAP
jgi:3-oxoacyl-[acyl-carrier-protein] synthase II